VTTRLPIRIEPLPGEWWRGYVMRVASCYGVQPRALLSSVPGATVLTRQGLTWSGTVATPEAIRELAHAFRLDPHEVDRMHLSAFNGSALRIRGSGPCSLRSHQSTPCEQASHPEDWPHRQRGARPLVPQVRG
jgi:hypothetical protein